MTPKLKSLKEEFDFLHKKIGELEWEKATLYYGKIAVRSAEIDNLNRQLENYYENLRIVIEKIHVTVEEANKENGVKVKSLIKNGTRE